MNWKSVIQRAFSREKQELFQKSSGADVQHCVMKGKMEEERQRAYEDTVKCHILSVSSNMSHFMSDRAVFWCQVITYFSSFVKSLSGKRLISFDLLACGPTLLAACFGKKCFLGIQLHCLFMHCRWLLSYQTNRAEQLRQRLYATK